MDFIKTCGLCFFMLLLFSCEKKEKPYDVCQTYPFDFEILGPYNCDEFDIIYDSLLQDSLKNKLPWGVFDEYGVQDSLNYLLKVENLSDKDFLILCRNKYDERIIIGNWYGLDFDSLGFLRIKYSPAPFYFCVFDTIGTRENRYSHDFFTEERLNRFGGYLIVCPDITTPSGYLDSLNKKDLRKFYYDSENPLFFYPDHPFFLFKRTGNKFEKDNYEIIERELKKTYEFYKDKPELFKKTMLR